MTQVLKALAAAGLRSFPEVQAFCETPPFNLRVTERGPLYALRYRRGASDLRSPVVRQARGLVLEKGTNRIVSWAFDKFYEYGEDAPSYKERPNLRRSSVAAKARFERKYDGALIKVVRLPCNELLVSTNGKIDAAEAPLMGAAHSHSMPDGDLGWPNAADSAGDACRGVRDPSMAPRNLKQIFDEAGGLALPYKEGYCYMFELLHPDLPTVSPAPWTALVHLATRCLSGEFAELPPEERLNTQGVKSPEVLDFHSFGACRDAARILPWDDEGFVIADGIGNRIKVKSDAYRAMQCLLAGDSACQDEDELAVALTLHSAVAPLPAGIAERIRSWRSSLDTLVEVCAARAENARASAACTGRSARGIEAAMETAIGGRIPRRVRAVVVGAYVQWLVTGGTGVEGEEAVSRSVAILRALRQSRLGLGELVTALRVM